MLTTQQWYGAHIVHVRMHELGSIRQGLLNYTKKLCFVHLHRLQVRGMHCLSAADRGMLDPRKSVMVYAGAPSASQRCAGHAVSRRMDDITTCQAAKLAQCVITQRTLAGQQKVVLEGYHPQLEA